MKKRWKKGKSKGRRKRKVNEKRKKKSERKGIKTEIFFPPYAQKVAERRNDKIKVKGAQTARQKKKNKKRRKK